MKNKTKTAFIILASVIIIPQMALASWWNPLSWKVFTFLHNKEVPAQLQLNEQKTSEEKIDELQKQIEDLRNKQLSDFIEEIPEVEETNKILPIIDNSSTIKKEIKVGVDAELKLKAEQEALVVKEKAEKQAKIDNENQARLEAEQVKLDRQNSLECVNAKKARDKATEQLNKYMRLSEKTDISSSESSELASKIAHLSIGLSPLTSEYSKACYGFYSASSNTTVCNFIGNIVYCN